MNVLVCDDLHGFDDFVDMWLVVFWMWEVQFWPIFQDGELGSRIQ